MGTRTHALATLASYMERSACRPTHRWSSAFARTRPSWHAAGGAREHARVRTNGRPDAARPDGCQLPWSALGCVRPHSCVVPELHARGARGRALRLSTCSTAARWTRTGSTMWRCIAPPGWFVESLRMVPTSRVPGQEWPRGHSGRLSLTIWAGWTQQVSHRSRSRSCQCCLRARQLLDRSSAGADRISRQVGRGRCRRWR